MKTFIVLSIVTLLVLFSNMFSAWLGLSFVAWLFSISGLVTKVTVLIAGGVVTLLQAGIVLLFANSK